MNKNPNLRDDESLCSEPDAANVRDTANATNVQDTANDANVAEYNEDSDRKKKKNRRFITFLKSNPIVRVTALLTAFALFFGAGYLTFYLSLDSSERSLLFVYKNYKDHYYFENDEKTPADALADSLLDIYSDYYTPEEYAEVLKSNESKRTGFGISFSFSDGQIFVYKVSGNSPAEHEGLKKGGKVVGCSINEAVVPVDDYSAFSDALSGAAPDAVLKLTVKYGETEHEYEIIKSEYRESYVYYSNGESDYGFNDLSGEMKFVRQGDSSVEVGEEWAYIRYLSFNGASSGLYGSVGQFETAMNKAVSDGKTKIIIDLRNNGGGFMSVLCKIAAMVCKNVENGSSKRVVQSVEYKDGTTQYFYIDESYAKTEDGRRFVDCFESIVFLANENTASASEALIGAALDYDGSSSQKTVSVVLDGSTDSNGNEVYKSYGKGIMQTTYVNGVTGEAIKLTTAALFWPITRTCIHGSGITVKTNARVHAATSVDAVALAQTL